MSTDSVEMYRKLNYNTLHTLYSGDVLVSQRVYLSKTYRLLCSNSGLNREFDGNSDMRVDFDKNLLKSISESEFEVLD